MTKRRDQREKRFRDEAKEKTQHDEVRERHTDAKVESELLPKKKSREDVNQAPGADRKGSNRRIAGTTDEVSATVGKKSPAAIAGSSAAAAFDCTHTNDS